MCVCVHLFYVRLQCVTVLALIQHYNNKHKNDTSSRGPAGGFIIAAVRKEGKSGSEDEHAVGGIENGRMERVKGPSAKDLKMTNGPKGERKVENLLQIKISVNTIHVLPMDAPSSTRTLHLQLV